MNSIFELTNRAGEHFVRFAMPMLIQSSVLIALLFAADSLLKRRVRAVVRYGLWMLLPVKLLLPSSLSLPTGLGYWIERPALSRLALAPTSRQRTPASFPDTIQTAGNHGLSGLVSTSNSVEAGGSSRPSGASGTAPARAAHLELSAFLFLAWVLGMTGMSTFLIQRLRLVRRLVAHAKTAPPELLWLLDACAAELRIARSLSLKVTNSAMSPAVCGFVHPTILIPDPLTTELDRQQLRAVLLHELAHIKRADLWLNHAQTLLQILYFYHPLLWLANAAIRRVREEAVDEMVLVAMGTDAETYPETLLSVAKLWLQRPAFALGMIGIMESKSALGRRLRRMLSQPLPRSGRLSLASGAVLLICAAVLLPMAKAQRKEEKAPAQAVKTVATKSSGEPSGSYQGKSFDQWLDQINFFRSYHEKDQVEPIRAFLDAGDAALPFLRDKLRAPAKPQEAKAAVETRRKATWVLQHLGSAAEPAIPELIGALGDDETVAAYAAQALAKIGPKAQAAVPRLLESARFGNGQAAKALAAIAPDDPEIVPTLIDMVKNRRLDGLGQPAINAAAALGKLGKRGTGAIPVLRAGLANSDFRMRHFAIEALRRIAPDQIDVMAEVEEAEKKNRLPPPPPISEALARAKEASSSERIQALAGLNQAISYIRYQNPPLPSKLIHEELLPFLKGILDDADFRIRQLGAEVASAIGPEASQLVPKLIEMLSNDPTEQGNLINAISYVSPGDSRILPFLIKVIRQDTTILRINAAAALKKFGPEAKEAVPVLESMLKNKERLVISDIGMTDSDLLVRWHANLALWSIARRPPDIAIFRRMLSQDENDHFASLEIAKVCGEMGPAAKEAIPLLKELLGHWNSKVREEAKAALSKVSPSDAAQIENGIQVKPALSLRKDTEKARSSLAAESIPSLFNKLEMYQHRTWKSQAAIFAALEERSSGTVAYLSQLLSESKAENSGSVAAKRKAAWLLGELGPRAELAVPSLIQAVETGDDQLRNLATRTLGLIGPPAKSAIPLLIEELEFQNIAAAEALTSIAPDSPEIAKALVKAFQKSSLPDGFRGSIPPALGKMKAQANLIVPALIAALSEDRETKSELSGATPVRYIQSQALSALRQLRDVSPEARAAIKGKDMAETLASAPWTHATKADVPRLLDRLHQDHNDLDALNTLIALREESAQAVPLLIAILGDRNARFRGSAANALGNIGPAAAPAIPFLVQATRSDEIGLSINSIAALGEIGPAAKSALPVLETLFQEDNVRVRWHAMNALRRIDPSSTDRALSFFIAHLNDPEGSKYLFPETTARMLGEMGSKAKPGLVILREALKSSDLNYRRAAAWAIVQIDPSQTDLAVSTLIKTFAIEEGFNRSNVASTLGAIGPPAKAAVPMLLSAVQDENEMVRKAASEALSKIDPERKIFEPKERETTKE